MTLYSITVSISERGFDVDTIKSEVILYEKGGLCKIRQCGFEKSFESSELDKYNTGLLVNKVPRISIETIGEELIDTYVVEMKNRIKAELDMRLRRTQEQLDWIKS